MIPTTRTELKEYALRRLGYPVIQINCSDDQLEDAIDDSLRLYSDFHMDGQERHFLMHQVTQDTIDNMYFDIPNDILQVSKVLTIGQQSTKELVFNVDYQVIAQTILSLYPGCANAAVYSMGLSDYAQTKSYLETLNLAINGTTQFRYNRNTNRIYLDTKPELLALGNFICVDVSKNIDPEVHTRVYSDVWLGKYVASQIKLRWGENMSKYSGVRLPGGVTMNGQEIKNEAKQEIQELEYQLKQMYGEPAVFFMA